MCEALSMQRFMVLHIHESVLYTSQLLGGKYCSYLLQIRKERPRKVHQLA